MKNENSVNPVQSVDGRRHWLLAAVAAAAGLGGASLAWWKFSPGAVDDGAAAAVWDMKFESPAGEPLSMAGLKGRPLLINFWATWCPPCVEELPLLDAFYKENVSNGWQVLGLAVDKAGAVGDFLKRQPLSFPVALAAMNGVGLSKSLGNLSGGLPFSVVFGADGTIRHRKIGKVSPADLANWRQLK